MQPPPGLAVMTLQVLAISGYGLWLLLGLALGLAMYPSGRGDALVPLTLGTVLVSAGPLLACLRLPVVPDWLGWRFGRGSRPTREGMIALLAYLPMLALAGLVRGDNAFWATRLSGAALAFCSLACLIYTARGYGRRPVSAQVSLWRQLPLSRVVSACYTGGLWLWLCLVGQASAEPLAITSTPWILALQLLALLLGWSEGMRWQSLQAGKGAPVPKAPGHSRGLWIGRFIAAILIYVIPCVVLLLAQVLEQRVLLVALAAVSCVVGKSVEQRLYDAALAIRGDPA
ncbi:hypothetical protein [Dyella subtropica]|uniref:hypothetical protein n=1 Tax=Dyella subtropica TaxID=2992127 RepID=UPI002256E6F0|nr:hypothetical protein [Dyella subtropica]